MNTRKLFLSALVVLLFSGISNAQVGIGTNTPSPSVQFEVFSTERGFLPPRLTTAQRDLIATPATGLLIFQTDNTAGYYYYNGTTWVNLGAMGAAGTNGTNGLNALIKTTTEPSGSNCINSGTKIETGLDANGNGVLDVSEINTNQTKYVCNGNNVNSSINGSFNGNSILSNDTVSPLMRYIGNGQEGAFNCSNFSGVLSGEHFYTNFKVESNYTLNIQPSNTTIIHVKDTCFVSGIINGNGAIVPTFQETRDFLGATGDYSGSSCGGQSGYYYTFNWGWAPDGLNQLLGWHTKTTGQRWNGVSMGLNDMRIASFLGVKIHGCSSNMFNCNVTSQGGAGLIIICRVLVFDGQITLNGTNGPTGASGGGSLIISTDNVSSNTGSVSQIGGIIPPWGSILTGKGYYYLINY